MLIIFTHQSLSYMFAFIAFLISVMWAYGGGYRTHFLATRTILQLGWPLLSELLQDFAEVKPAPKECRSCPEDVVVTIAYASANERQEPQHLPT